MNKSKQKGTAAETAIVNYLNHNGIKAVRNPPSGSSDRGDINIFLPVAIEVKNCAKMELSEWLKEAEAEKKNLGARVGIVWHKKKGTTDPGSWYVTMTGDDFVKMIDYARYYYSAS